MGSSVASQPLVAWEPCAGRWMTGGSAASSGLYGRSSQPRKPHTIRARSPPPPPSSKAIGRGVEGRAYMAMFGSARIPGALESTWGSPLGNMMRSPSPRRTGSAPTAWPQHEPRAITWYSITRSAPGITIAAISWRPAPRPPTASGARGRSTPRRSGAPPGERPTAHRSSPRHLGRQTLGHAIRTLEQARVRDGRKGMRIGRLLMARARMPS
jgi:hypothetical protein